MADNSPGKVQALRAMFSEQNRPVMGLMPPGGKIPNKPWRSLDNSNHPQDSSALREKRLTGNKVLPVTEMKTAVFNGDGSKDSCAKPAVGPKPSHLVQGVVPAVSCDKPVNTDLQLKDYKYGIVEELATPSQPATKAGFGETIASFMFASNNKENEDITTKTAPPSCPLRSAPPTPLASKPRISHLLNCPQNHVDIMNFCNSRDVRGDLDSIISSDNYICKSNCNVRRKQLPSSEKLGPAPLKPSRPSHLRLPSSSPRESSPSLAPPQVPPPILSQKAPLQRPSYPCPPRPVTPPPLPPVLAPVIKPPQASLREEIEELYEDTLLGENKRPVSLIPEYTEEEEQAELYHDAADGFDENSSFSDYKYRKLPPSIPSEYLQPNTSGSTEELYQDADGLSQEEFYEVMPCDEIPDDYGSPLYSNNKKEIEKMRKEEEKRIRKEQKEKEKREKELEKIRKKFGLTGEEIPIDDGLVKWDSRGGKGDLPVKRGETVLILRMEGNPSGRWLVKNEKGKIGYVELTNIEVDPLSVKSVMSIRRLSVMSASEELYCEAKSGEEAIYEVTY